MARSGMSNLLGRLRRLVDDSGTAVWSQDQLQTILDEHVTRVYQEPLAHERTWLAAGTYVYKIFQSAYANYEEGGTAYFNIETSDGTQRGTTTYTADYVRGVVTMTTDQMGTALYLTGYSYDVNGAAADCWRERATTRASDYNFGSDGARFDRSQWFDHCLKMADYYAAQTAPYVVKQWTGEA